MERRRRRRRLGKAVRLGLVIAVLLWLGIRAGTGLAPRDVSTADIGADGVGRSEESVGRSEEIRPPSAAEPGPAPAVEPGSVPEVELAADVEPDVPDPAVADRLWGCLRAMASGEPDRAFAAVEIAGSMALDEDQRERLDRAVVELERRASAEVGRALAGARRGRVLDGVDALRTWFEAERDEARAVLASAFEAESLPAPRPGGAVELDPPGPWARGTPARVRHAGAMTDAEVFEARGTEVTVRVAGPAGWMFPTLPRTAVEPTDDDPDHALSQAVAALRAGERLLGAAWLVRARACGADPVRLAELGEMLAR